MLELLKNLLRDIHAMLGRIPFVAQLVGVLIWIWVKPLGPIRRFLWFITWKVIDWYIGIWRKLTHNRYGGFVYWRGALMVLLTVFCVTLVIPATITGSWMAITYVDENVELLSASEIIPEENVWNVRGRELENKEESLYYRVEYNWAHQVWSVLFMRRWFLPDDIASGVPTGLTNCRVISYGIRVKWLMRHWEWYPSALYINCSPNRGGL